MKECAELFYIEKFEERLDSRENLIGFDNGVFDLDTMEFREGRPEDYVSFTTGCDYVEYDPTQPNLASVRQFVSQILPKPAVREYVLKLFATFLHGSVKEQKFNIWTGSGCHAIDTGIMMYDGSIKKVQDIEIGEQLMGDDSTPRTVQQLFRGNADMYRIKPIKGDPFTVNGDHILSLQLSNNTTSVYKRKDRKNTWIARYMEYDDDNILVVKTRTFRSKRDANAHIEEQLAVNNNLAKDGEVIDVMVKKYLQHVKRIGSRTLCLYRPQEVSWPEKSVPMDPYAVGTLFVEGGKDYLMDPMLYKCNSRDVRLKVLAGVIDTAGNYDITLKSEDLIDAVIYIARSLGFACYKTNTGGEYFRAHIVGAGIEDIPTKLLENKAEQIDNANSSRRLSFKVERVQDGGFYGFELDGNHRYLMEDFIVTHNSNGKSICITLFEKAFGDYCCKFPITLLTQKRAASNAATSELARAKGKRFASLQEPSEGEHINCGLMKELSGGDKIMARSLFKEPIEFVPQFKMVLLCNHLPHVPSDDGGTWRRIRVVEFTSKFVDNPVEENEYPIDYDLPNKLESWKSHFMAMLLEYYKLYKVEGMTEPEEVMKCTNEYKRQNDHLAEFIHTCVEKKESKVMYLNDAFNELKSWVKDDNIPIKIPTKAELEKYFAKQGMGRCVIVNNLKAFKGYSIKSRFQTTSDETDGLD